MKIKLTKEQIEKILADPEQAQKAGIQTNDPWWVIVLKVLAYLIGLLLAGAATTSCAAAAVAHMMWFFVTQISRISQIFACLSASGLPRSIYYTSDTFP